MEFTLKIDQSRMTAKINNLKKIVDQCMPDIYNKFESVTPVAKGNARGNTYREGNTIHANYPYAQVLNAGRGYRDGQMRGSEQAPQGMVKPTVEFAKNLITARVRSEGKK